MTINFIIIILFLKFKKNLIKFLIFMIYVSFINFLMNFKIILSLF